MAAPSLGQAIGLNVERKDIFAPAAKQLAVNLADIKAEKRRKAKEKEETASKAMSDMFKLNPDGYNRKVRKEAVNYHNGKVSELEKLMENPDVSQIDLIKKIEEARTGLASFKDQSDSFDNIDKLILSDPNKVPVPLRSFINSPDLIPSTNQQTIFAALNIDYDPSTNTFRSIGPGKMDVREELINNKASADALLANMTPEERNKSMVKVKTMTGYDPKAFIVLKPDQQSYLLNLSNVMSNNPSALNTISDEIIESVYGGDINKYSAAVTKIIEDQYQKDLAAASATPGAAQAVPKMLAKDAMNLMATEYMLEKNFPEYVQRTTSLEDLNKTAQSKGDEKGKGQASPGDVSEEPHFTEKGLAFIEKEGLSPTEAINIFVDENHPKNKKVRAALGGQIYASAPTVAFAPGPGEPITMKGQSVNPLRMWFNPKNNKFYLDYNIVASKESVNKSMPTKVMELSSEDMKTLRSFQNKSVQEGIAKWDSLAPSIKIKSRGYEGVRVMTTDEYAGSSGSSRRPSGKKKKVF
jgi:hypothetical protein